MFNFQFLYFLENMWSSKNGLIFFPPILISNLKKNNNNNNKKKLKENPSQLVIFFGEHAYLKRQKHKFFSGCAKFEKDKLVVLLES